MPCKPRLIGMPGVQGPRSFSEKCGCGHCSITLLLVTQAASVACKALLQLKAGISSSQVRLGELGPGSAIFCYSVKHRIVVCLFYAGSGSDFTRNLYSINRREKTFVHFFLEDSLS